MSQKQLIIKYLGSLQGEWVRAYELRGKSTKFGFLGHQADRRARELARSGEINHRIKDGYAEYQAKTLKTEFPNPRIESYRSVFLQEKKLEISKLL